MDRDDRPGGECRPGDQGGGREPIPDPVAVDGADAPLCAPGAWLPGRPLGSRGRESIHLPLPGSSPRRDRRLRDAPAGGGALWPGRRLREAPDRAARRRRHDARRLRLGEWKETCGALRSGLTRGPDVWSMDGAGRKLFHDGRQPRSLVRLAHVGARVTRRAHRPGRRHVLASTPDRHSLVGSEQKVRAGVEPARTLEGGHASRGIRYQSAR